MNTLEILMPLCGKPKYLQRLADFQRLGLVNTDGVKMHVRALIGTEDPALFREGWRQDCELVPGPVDQVAQKIYTHYAGLSVSDLERAQWFMRVDDDSSTDVAGLCAWLEQFDPAEPHYFTTKQCWDLPDFYADALTRNGFGHFHARGNRGKNGGLPINTIPHEWECCVVSQAMLWRIMRHRQATKLLADLAAIPKGWGDMGLALAARITGIAIAEVEVLTARPDVRNFSPLGGHINHIHFVAHDLPYWRDFTSQMERAGYGA